MVSSFTVTTNSRCLLSRMMADVTLWLSLVAVACHPTRDCSTASLLSAWLCRADASRALAFLDAVISFMPPQAPPPHTHICVTLVRSCHKQHCPGNLLLRGPTLTIISPFLQCLTPAALAHRAASFDPVPSLTLCHLYWTVVFFLTNLDSRSLPVPTLANGPGSLASFLLHSSYLPPNPPSLNPARLCWIYADVRI